jgi:hypothetical protein
VTDPANLDELLALPLWQCDDCFTESRSLPLAHDDTGGLVRVYGPHCPECGCPMRFVEDPADARR